MSTVATEPAIITKLELSELADAEAQYVKAKGKLSSAEENVKLLRMRLAEKVLGVKTEDEFKQLSPADLVKKQIKRLAAGDWKPERGSPEFSFVNTSKGRYPAWRKLYVSEMGETEAARIQSETDYSYSYRVEVSA